MAINHNPKMTFDNISQGPTTELTNIQNQLKVYNIKEAILNGFKEAESLKCEDAKSRKMIGKFRTEAKSLRGKIEKSRLDKNRETLAANNGAATAIKDRLDISINAYDSEILPYDQAAKDKADAKKRAEADRLALISEQIENLKSACAAPLEYNISSLAINSWLLKLESIEITDLFQEMKPQAEMIKIGGIASAKQALKSRQEWESQQAENERIRIENEKKAKELADKEADIETKKEKARIEAEKIAKESKEKQDNAEAEARAKREKAAASIVKERKEFEEYKSAEKEKERLLKESNEKRLEEDRKKIQAEKVKMAAEAEKVKMAERIKRCESIGNAWYCADFDEAQELDGFFNYGWGQSLEKDEEIRIEKLASDEKRAALIAADKKVIAEYGLKIDESVSTIALPKITTDEAAKIINGFHAEINKAINKLEKSLIELT